MLKYLNYKAVNMKNITFLCFFLITSVISATDHTPVIRAAIDVGSGGPKLRVAEVDLGSNKIEKIICIKQYPVRYQDSLSQSDDQSLSAAIMLEGLTAFKEAVALA